MAEDLRGDQTKKHDETLKQMEEQVKRTVDINYHRYNDVYVDKALERSESFQRDRDRSANEELGRVTEDSSRYLHGRARGRKYYV